MKKIYRKLVIDIASMQVEFEDSYLSTEPVAECKGGSGSTSGATDYPDYMKRVHGYWLDYNATDMFPESVNKCIANAKGTTTNPYATFAAFSPDEAFFSVGKYITSYTSPFEYMKTFSLFDTETKYNSYLTDDSAEITAAVSVFSNSLTDEINTKTLPQFQHGMSDINAVMSSAFVIGEAIIWDSKVKKVAEFEANLRLQHIQTKADIALRRISIALEYNKTVVSLGTELARMYTAARTDVDGDKLDAAVKAKLWDLELWQYGTQVMASIAGAATVSKGVERKNSSLAGALSGALSGAAAGSMIPGVGTALGGAVGLLGGLFG